MSVLSFCVVTLLGLMSLGVTSNRVTRETMDEANMVSRLIAIRSAAPMADLSQQEFPLPPANAPAVGQNGGPVVIALGADGRSMGQDFAGATAENGFRLLYTVTPDDVGRVSTYRLTLLQPASADPNQASRYEVTTYISY